MKILEANAGPLTNFEVLEFLRSKGAAKDPTRVLAKVAPSEYKVYDYLVGSAACNQTKESINEFVEKCKPYKLAKAEVLNIINIRPASQVGIYPFIEACETRLNEDEVAELADLVDKILPAPPVELKPEGINNDIEETEKEGQEKDNTITEDQDVDKSQMETS
ncbi:DNA-directed RNA polymerase III subunit rpc9-like [Quillaja saponaria]|uniref:DNA-directed RNA polymerase III subunit RPC9 n=1 Tax=Quillaja saponaria TaxID=32244 RepID=A0AAD7VLB4_QUISA|nr:DNA-directed RNA polymerase III subunit rpc9-like [Quillaja saponaria]